MKIHTVGVELFHKEGDGQTGSYNETNSRFHNSANAPKNLSKLFM